MEKRRKIKGVFDIMFVREDFFRKYIQNCTMRKAEDPPWYKSDRVIEWRPNFERDENGEPVIKKGFAKVYIYGVFYRCWGGYGEDKKTGAPYIWVDMNFKNDVNDRYARVSAKIQRDPELVKFYPLNINEQVLFEKKDMLYMTVDEEIW